MAHTSWCLRLSDPSAIPSFSLLMHLQKHHKYEFHLLPNKSFTSLASILTILLRESSTSLINNSTFVFILFVDFNVDFCLELTHIDEVCNCELHVFKEVVEGTCKVQILSEFSVESLIPIIITIIHSNEAFK